MIRFRDAPASSDPAQTSLAVGIDLDDALACFGQQDDCIGCMGAIAAPRSTPDSSVERIRTIFTPLSETTAIVRPSSGPSGMLRRSRYWTDVDIDARAQRLRSVRMPSPLVGNQRLLAVNDLRGNAESRPTIALGLWAEFAHPVVRMGARLGGTTDGLVAEIALAVHPDRYVLIDSLRQLGLTYVFATTDIMCAELVPLALRAERGRGRSVGPWEDRLVQAATDLDLGARTSAEFDIEAVLSSTLSSEQRGRSESLISGAAELIGVVPVS